MTDAAGRGPSPGQLRSAYRAAGTALHAGQDRLPAIPAVSAPRAPVASRPVPSSVVVRVPAKVNLRLGVGPLRPDGYHELLTVFHAVALFDEVEVSEAAGLSLTVAGTGAGELPGDRANLAWRAAELLAATAGMQPQVALRLRKAIPVAGGLAGGSADAAGTLLACARLWDVSADLPHLAAQLGSDIGFCLLGGTAIGTGRGEQLVPVPAHAELHWVLATASY